jgi:hypothetical protein
LAAQMLSRLECAHTVITRLQCTMYRKYIIVDINFEHTMYIY